ncbi:hypothetical protein, unlikely [Trypanosoma brucei brucei TREU927]|uniref:Uncharacterized protein n=1 Tax=Trypanosoma brucei brucei (strain 927/4 GUTat10.1) TaxID=185431 RepID=Q4GZG6_TRYB2|nr:hypothetical protein, unlikely [Trypanosoma brucei brucei TREU927]CAJ15969.1 hypothetical protein, unlikely [Trypanosoma brucei brucei TREU927]
MDEEVVLRGVEDITCRCVYSHVYVYARVCVFGYVLPSSSVVYRGTLAMECTFGVHEKKNKMKKNKCYLRGQTIGTRDTVCGVMCLNIPPRHCYCSFFLFPFYNPFLLYLLLSS